MASRSSFIFVLALAGGCGTSHADHATDAGHDVADAERHDGDARSDGRPDAEGRDAKMEGGALRPVTDGQWHWYDVPGTTCLDGATQAGRPSGVGLNVPVGGGTGKLLIWMEGGGFCYDTTTCYTNFPDVFPNVSRTSYTGANFDSSCTGMSSCNYADDNLVAADRGQPIWSCSHDPPLPHCGKAERERGLWDRSPGTVNPFRGYTFVYVPYCTGDLHQGHHSPSPKLQFVGHENFSLDAKALYTTFPSPPAIVLGGRSAGGDGAFFDYEELRRVYSDLDLPVTVISDSASPFWTGTPSAAADAGDAWTRQGYWLRAAVGPLVPSYVEDSFASAWGLAKTAPPAVVPFTPPGALHAIYPQQDLYMHALDRNPEKDRFGLIVGSNDFAIPAYLHLETDGALPSMAEAIADFAANVVRSKSSPHANAHLLVVSSATQWNPAFLPWREHHIYLDDDVSVWGPQGSGGSGVLDFLTSPVELGITP
jgi:hypothetical protein